MIGHVQVEALPPAPTVEVSDLHPLVPAGVLPPTVPRVVRGRAGIARVRTIVLQQGETALAVKLVQPSEIVGAPPALKAGRIPKHRLEPRGQDHVMPPTDAARGQKRIASDLHAPAPRIAGEGLGFLQRLRPLVLHVEAAAKTQDEHLETSGCTLVDGIGHRRPVGGHHVHHQRVLGHPGGHRAHHPTHGQATPLAVCAVLRQDPGPIGLEGRPGRHPLIGSQIRPYVQQAWGLLLVIDLRMEFRIGQPPVGTPIGSRPGHSPERHVGLDMEVGRRQPDRQLIHFRNPLDRREHLAGEPVDRHRRGRCVAHGQPLRITGEAVVQFVVH